MKILICGHRSFAAQGLDALLKANGHEVVCFNRGAIGKAENIVTGPVDQIHLNPYLQDTFDGVVNHILLKDADIEKNLAYADALLKFCDNQKIKHLIHIGSVSSFKAEIHLINEAAEVETNFGRKGSYGSIKAASDHYISTHLPPGTKLSLLRPGFILGEGVGNPIIGTAARTPWNRLLVLGSARSQFPLITRDLVHQSILKVIGDPPAASQETLLLVNDRSPTRKAYLQACCTRLGCAAGVQTFPELLWWGMALGGEGVARAIGKRNLKPFLTLASKLTAQRFDSRRTQKRLGLNFHFPWKTALQKSLEAQERNFALPYRPRALKPLLARQITFLGYGRIVRSRHLPALSQLDFKGEIRAFDLNAATADNGQTIEPIEGATLPPADLLIVATPGPAHVAALATLKTVSSPILVEKPLCYSPQELEQWREFAATREAATLVCHNYRFKANVRQMLETLERFNPGALRHVNLHFDSPAVSAESAAWMRNERRAKTLLMDYSIHFLDVACLFGQGPWQVDGLRHQLNSRGETALIEGRLMADNYGVSFLLRQGFGPRKAQVNFAFQNYSVRLGFFPDTCVVYMSDESAWLHKQEARALGRGTYEKIGDLLLNRVSDLSHAFAIEAAANHNSSQANSITIESLQHFYRALFEISERVYND